MIILQLETAEHRNLGTSSPQGEPGLPPSVLTPLHCNTCGGCRDALPGHYLCCSRETNVTTPFCTGHGGGHQSRRAGGASLCRGTPALRHARARAAILVQCQIKGNHRMISQSVIPSILLVARRKARQQGNIDGLVYCLTPLKRLYMTNVKTGLRGTYSP